MFKNSIQKYFIYFFLSGGLLSPCAANDELGQLMADLKNPAALKIYYQETRNLELIDRPWRGSGYMYALPPNIMIREQLQPQRLLMGIDADHLYYFDPVNDIRHQAEMDEEDPLSLNIAVFKALMNADQILLHKIYQVEFRKQIDRWQMILTPRKTPDSGFTIEISGFLQQPADNIQIKQADGDTSIFSLKQTASVDELETKVKRLYTELLDE